MATARRIAGIGFALVLVAALAAIGWKREELVRLWAVNTLFDAERIVGNFSTMDRLFPTVPVPRGDGPVMPLPAGPPLVLPAAAEDWIEARRVTALVVLADGALVHETYRLGTAAEDLRISWSISKSVLSAMLGILIDEGAIGGLDDPVVRHAPALAGGAYDGATVGDVLGMASGVAFDEDVTDPRSDLSRMGRVLALGGSMDAFATGLTETAGPPGETWRYVSIDTHVIGMVIRGATGRSIPDLISERVVAPLGLEASPRYVTDGEGTAFVLGGLMLRTRDAARFGQMILDGGRAGGRQVVPAAWVRASTRPRPPEPAHLSSRYGLHWRVPADAGEGETMAEGVYGQYLYIDPATRVVIAVNAADRDFQGSTDATVEILRGIAAAARRGSARPGGRRRRAA